VTDEVRWSQCGDCREIRLDFRVLLVVFGHGADHLVSQVPVHQVDVLTTQERSR
jgi:hypothetical protein